MAESQTVEEVRGASTRIWLAAHYGVIVDRLPLQEYEYGVTIRARIVSD